MLFNIRVKVLGHTFNIRNVEAENEVQARIKVLNMVESKTTIESVHPGKPDVKDLMDMLNISSR